MMEQATMEESLFKNPMFADTLLETSRVQHARRGCTTLTRSGCRLS